MTGHCDEHLLELRQDNNEPTRKELRDEELWWEQQEDARLVTNKGD